MTPSERVGVALAAVLAGTPAAKAGLAPGDQILEVDGQLVEDALDLAYACSEDRFVLTVRTKAGRLRRVRISRPLGRPWGGVAEPPPLKYCGNRCIFCFVEQMPEGLRPSLYVKDEDYRHSFLFGNYVTLTNLQTRDLERIKRLHLSPLYISVHATDPEVRLKLLGRRRAPEVLPMLHELARAGIQLHTQAVICPGWNDGKVLERTVADLAALFPAVRSLALVPVGLTRHRQRLTPLRPVSAREARDLLARVERWQKKFLAEFGTRWVFATDEWYLRSGRSFPKDAAYEDYPQIENGVGIGCRFLDEVKKATPEPLPSAVSPRAFLVPAGVLAAPVVRRALRPFGAVRGLEVRVIAVPNRLFGPTVTVTGLLAGADILEALQSLAVPGRRVLLPPEPLRHEQGLFLDGLRVRDLARQLRIPVAVMRDPRHLVRTLVAPQPDRDIK